MTGAEHYCLINNIYKDRKLLKRQELWKSHIRVQRPSRLWLFRLTNQWSAVVLPFSIRSVCEVPQQKGYEKKQDSMEQLFWYHLHISTIETQK